MVVHVTRTCADVECDFIKRTWKYSTIRLQYVNNTYVINKKVKPTTTNKNDGNNILLYTCICAMIKFNY
jgi:hypothetical protein